MANGGIIGTVNNPTSTTATGVWQQEEQYEAVRDGTWPEKALFTTKSLRFNPASSDYLNRTPSSAFNTDKWTISLWFKRGNLGIDTRLISCDNDNGSNDDYIRFDSSDQMEFMIYEGSSVVGLLKPNRVFRDPSAWMHLVCVWDSANGTAGNRMRMYINGTEETSFATDTNPSSGANASFGNTSHPIEVGRRGSANNQYFDGYMAEVISVDGQALAPTSFGSTNSDGVWIPAIYTGTYGTSGFNLQFENAAALGTDSSPNGNTFTVNNLTSIDQSTDYPEVNYATMNPLFAGDANITYAEGNLKTTAANQSQKNAVSTIAVSSGKWYCEMVSRNGTNYPGFGIMDSQSVLQTSVSYLGSSSDSYCMFQDGNYYTSGSASNTGTSWGVGSIMGISIDLDSGTKTIKFYKNGSQTHSATISTPANAYVFAVSHNDNGTIAEINFGSPSFAISSGNADGNGYGNFEYAVPSGYYALNTANLAEFG